MTSLTLDAEALARHRNMTRWQADKARRSIGYRLDSDGSGIAVELPGPAVLADLLTLPETYRRGSAIVTATGDPLDLLALAEDLRGLLAALPLRADALAPYRDLRLAASTSSPKFDTYLLDVLRLLRRSLPAEPRPVAEVVQARPLRGPAKSHAEHARDARARRRSAEEASADAWLRAWLDPEDPPEPRAYRLADLHAEAVEALLEWHDSGETLDDGREYAEPGPRVFARVLDRYLGETRKRTKHGTTYTLTNTEDDMSKTTELIIERAARMLADEAREEVETYTRREVGVAHACLTGPSLRLVK